MEFTEITENATVAPGEYLLYEPKQEIVMVGAFNRDQNFIRALMAGKLIEDKIDKFKKITLNRAERKERQLTRCKGCGR
jgi:hypothetical protein